MCLNSCASNEFETSSKSCSACSTTCSSCLRASDCNLNLDPLCSVFTDFTGCTTRKSLAVMTKTNICACVDDSSFNEKDATCACNQGFEKSGNLCVSATSVL